MRSVVVVFPASMWAAIPILRVRSSGVVLATVPCLASFPVLPAIMGKGLVGLGHLVGVFLLLHGPATKVGGIEDLVGQLLHHPALRSLAGEADDPAESEGRAAGGVHLHRHLVVRAAHAAALDLQGGLHVV